MIRKSIKDHGGSFPTEEAATKLIYLAIRNLRERIAAAGMSGNGWGDKTRDTAMRPGTNSP